MHENYSIIAIRKGLLLNLMPLGSMLSPAPQAQVVRLINQRTSGVKCLYQLTPEGVTLNLKKLGFQYTQLQYALKLVVLFELRRCLVCFHSDVVRFEGRTCSALEIGNGFVQIGLRLHFTTARCNQFLLTLENQKDR